MELTPLTSVAAEPAAPVDGALAGAAPAVGALAPAPRLAARLTARPERADETLVPDQRAGLSPAQYVERRLTTLLKGSALPVSHVRMARLCRKM